MKKKLFSIIIVLATAGCLIFSSADVEVTNNKFNSLEIFQYAQYNNLDLELLDKKVELSEAKLEESIAEKEEYADTAIERDRLNELYPLQRKKELEDAIQEKTNKNSEIYLNILQQYYNVFINDKLIQIQKTLVSDAKTLLENKQKQFKSGTISKSDLKEYEFSLQDEQNKLNELNNQKDTLIMDLNSLMGRDLNKNLNLHDLKEIPYTKYTVDNLDSIIEKFIETDYSIKSLKEQIEIYEVDKNIMEKYNGQEDENEKEYDFDDEIESLDIKILQLNYDIEDKKIELKYALLTDYNNLLKLEKQISINKLNYDTKTNSLQIADKKLKTGQITQTEYSKYNQDVINSLVDYEKSKMNYYIAVETFKLLIKK